MNEYAFKAAVRERDGNRCTGCGMTSRESFTRYGKNLDVHRLEPGSAYTLKGCVTVCKACHGSLPRRPPETYPREDRMLGVPLGLYKEIQRYAKDHSDEDDEKSISWAGRVLIKKALRAEGRHPPPPPPAPGD